MSVVTRTRVVRSSDFILEQGRGKRMWIIVGFCFLFDDVMFGSRLEGEGFMEKDTSV